MAPTKAPRTKEQNSRFHTLLTQRKFGAEEKEELVLACTGGRETSSAKMTMAEMAEAIQILSDEQDTSIKKMRSKIINICRDIFELKPRDEWTQAHYDSMNTFLQNKFKVPLHKLDYHTLIKAVTATEKWRDSAMNGMVKSLLNDI